MSIEKGENPVYHVWFLAIYGVLSMSYTPWGWCVKWVVKFI